MPDLSKITLAPAPQGFEINTATKDRIKTMLEKNGGHCPCQPARTPDTICPCLKFRAGGECCCGLYAKKEE